MKVAAFCLLLCISCGGDKDKSQDTETEEAVTCEETADCESGMVCLAGKCASTSGSAIYTDPANAITPKKVKAEVEAIQNRRQERADKILEGL